MALIVDATVMTVPLITKRSRVQKERQGHLVREVHRDGVDLKGISEKREIQAFA